MTEEKPKRKRGGGVKKAPPGYYMPREAREKLGMTESSFNYYVRQGKIKKYVPPLRSEGFYSKKEIDRLAAQMELFIHEITDEKQTAVTRIAQPVDAQGIVDVLLSFGWQTTTAQQRIDWYAVNPYVDYVALVDNSVVGGYIHAVPYTAETLEALMSGKKHSRQVQPSEILPYESGRTYDLYIGIALRKDIPHYTQRVGFRLISGFFAFIGELAEQQIFISRLYAVSDQEDGMKLCRDLGFVQLPAQEGDKFPRWMLDLETSDSRFARLYRETVQEVKQL